MREEDRHFDNTRVIHFPFNTGVGLAEMPMLTPICKVNPNVIVEVNIKDKTSVNVASIFKNIAKIVPTENFIDRECEGYPKRYPLAHCVIHFFDIYGIDSDDYIPYIVLDNPELDWAFKTLKTFDKPSIVLSPVAGSYHRKDKNALMRMLDFKSWEEILEILSKKYNIIYIALSNNFYPIKYTTPMLDLSIRQQAALMSVCGKFLGIESGMAHIGIASGAFCHILIPSFGYAASDERNGLLFDCYAYKDDMWKYQSKRVTYDLLKDYRNLLNYF
jgi:hypothetical protein